MLKAVCKTNIDPISKMVFSDLIPGQTYNIKSITIYGWHTEIELSDISWEKYNSVMFSFQGKDGNPISERFKGKSGEIVKQDGTIIRHWY